MIKLISNPNSILGCRMGEAKEVLRATDLEYITVWDYDMEGKGGFWNSAFSENIKMLIKDSHQSPTNMVSVSFLFFYKREINFQISQTY